MGSGGDDSGLVRDTRLPSAGPRVDQGMKIHHVFMTWKVTLDVSVIFDSGITEEVPVTRGCRVSTLWPSKVLTITVIIPLSHVVHTKVVSVLHTALVLKTK